MAWIPVTSVRVLNRVSSEAYNCCLSHFVNATPSDLSLLVDQNKGFVKSEVRKNCVAVDATLQLSHGKEAFESAKFSYPLA